MAKGKGICVVCGKPCKRSRKTCSRDCFSKLTAENQSKRHEFAVKQKDQEKKQVEKLEKLVEKKPVENIVIKKQITSNGDIDKINRNLSRLKAVAQEHIKYKAIKEEEVRKHWNIPFFNINMKEMSTPGLFTLLLVFIFGHYSGLLEFSLFQAEVLDTWTMAIIAVISGVIGLGLGRSMDKQRK